MRDWRLKQTTIRLTDDNYEYLRLRAFQERRSMSKLINDAIAEQRLRRDNQEDEQPGHPRMRMVSRETKRA
jgi:predicted transcriptional regulator